MISRATRRPASMARRVSNAPSPLFQTAPLPGLRFKVHAVELLEDVLQFMGDEFRRVHRRFEIDLRATPASRADASVRCGR